MFQFNSRKKIFALVGVIVLIILGCAYVGYSGKYGSGSTTMTVDNLNVLGLFNASTTTLSKPICATVGSANADYITNGSNDSYEINQAIGNCEINQQGGIVMIKSGSYAVTSTINFQNGIYVQGEGTSTLLNISAGKNLSFSGISNAGLGMVHIDAVNQVTSNEAVLVSNSSNLDFNQVILTNAQGFGFYIISSSGGLTSDVRIRNSYLYGLGNNDIIGGGPFDHLNSIVQGIRVLGTTLVQNAGIGANYQTAFDIVAAKNTIFSQNIVNGKVYFGFEQSPNLYDDFSDNTIYPPLGYTATGIYVTDLLGTTTSSQAFTITDNRLNSGIIEVEGNVTDTLKDVSIVGNFVSSTSGQPAIYLDYVTGATIDGNILNGVAGSGTAITLLNTTSTIIGSNSISNYLNVLDFSTNNSNYTILANTVNNVMNQTPSSTIEKINGNISTTYLTVATGTPAYPSIIGSGGGTVGINFSPTNIFMDIAGLYPITITSQGLTIQNSDSLLSNPAGASGVGTQTNYMGKSFIQNTVVGIPATSNVDFHGTADGCTAITWSSSSTAPTYSPTSTSNCL